VRKLGALRYLIAVPFAAVAAPASAQDAAGEGGAGGGSTQSTATGQAGSVSGSDATSEIKPHGKEILVIGGRIRGQVDAPQAPIVTLDEEDIAAYGADSLNELIDLLAPETTSGRGRGSGQPLFLLNGQRVSSFRELRDIPPEAIKRLEVLPEEVSLRYGFPPNQRVVNFILKDNFSSKTLSGEYDIPTLGGFDQGDASASLFKVRGPGRLNLTAKFNGTSMLTEAERGVIQDPSSVPTVSTDPDPADYRSLIDSSQVYTLNGNWSTGLGEKGLAGSLSLNGGYTRTDTRGLSGLDAVELTNPEGDTALRSVGEPLATVSHTDLVQSGATLNKSIAGWNLNATIDGSYTSSVSLIDRRADTAALVAEAEAGELAIDGPLPAVSDPGYDTARSQELDLTSVVTMSGEPFGMPAGATLLTAKGGFAYSHSRSTDTRELEPTTLTRGDLSASINLALPLTSRRNKVLGAVGDITLNLSAGVDHLTDFGTLIDWSAGMNWNVTGRLGLQASYIVNDQAPTLAQLGAPIVPTYNVPVYDFTKSRTTLVTVITGGNPDLPKERDHDIKLALNWQLPFLSRSNLVVEYFNNDSSDVTEAFPLLTPPIEAAFPGRVVRDAAGNLVSIDRRSVAFSDVASSRLRWGFNLSGSIGAGGGGGFGGPPRGGGGFGGPGGPGGGGSFGRANAPSTTAASPRTASAAGTGSGTGGQANANAGGGGGEPAGGGGPPPFGSRQAPRGGRWNFAIYHTYNITSTATVAPGVPELDLLNGDALTAGGVARHQITFEGGGFYKGIGVRLNSTWSAPVHVNASGAPGSSDLRFGSVFDINFRLFADLGRVPGLGDKSKFLKNARVMLKVENILNSRQKVTDNSGETPLAYQYDYLDPNGRIIGLDFRKMF
jgi:hypothetical protein